MTGSTGFVGKNLLQDLNKTYNIIQPNRNNCFSIPEEVDIVINLIGKAHDLKNIAISDDYYKINTQLAKNIFDAFINSKAKTFITISSVKAIADQVQGELTEETIPNPSTHYGKSKLLAEKYIISQPISDEKTVYILRPCMIHGPGNKGNLNLLYNLIKKGFPWPLGNYNNKRSYLSINNFCFVIKELIERDDIPSGIYNLADDIPLSTNEVIGLISVSNGKPVRILKLSKSIITILAKLGDHLKLPFNSERLQKLTDSYVVSNKKIISVLRKPLPISSIEGLSNTFDSFNKLYK